MEEFLKNHPSQLDLPRIGVDSGHTIFEFVPNDAGNLSLLIYLYALKLPQ